jgi:hypothetical protein
VTHPFHPLFGREFAIVTRRHYWSDQRLLFYDDQHVLVSIPLAWTDRAPVDPFVVLSAGRSSFRLEDLIELAQLVRRIRAWQTDE